MNEMDLAFEKGITVEEYEKRIGKIMEYCLVSRNEAVKIYEIANREMVDYD